MNFTAWSLNVRGLNQKKRRTLFRLIKKNDVQIALLQETYSCESVQNMWRNEWGGKAIWAHGASNSRGVAILIKPGCDFEILSEHRDDSGRFLLVKGKLQDNEVTFVNIYAPNNEDSKVHFFRYVRNKMTEHVNQTDTVLMGGDFNLIMDTKLDRKGGSFVETSKYKNIKNTVMDILNTFDMNDIWRIKNPQARRYTWRRKNPAIYSRLDYWFISVGLSDQVERTEVLSSTHSDHSIVSIRIKQSDNVEKGRGYWKLNNTFLDEEDYITGILSRKQEWEAEAETLRDPREIWEFLKYKIRQYSCNYGKVRAKTQRTEESKLRQELTTLEEKLDNEQTLDKDCTQTERDITNLKSDITEIENKKVEGLILRSGANWYEKGEKSSKYFLTLETRNKVRKTMNRLEDEHGEETMDPKKILKLQSKFYSELYTSKINKSSPDIDNYLKNVKIDKLSTEDQLSLEGKMTLEDCYKAVQTMKKNKSPGNDGLTVEFYQKFWSVFGKYVVNSFNTSYERGELSASQKQAVITLLDKGKDRCKISNWRPISLLNVDYKIMTKVLAIKIAKVMPKIIHHNQVGYVQGRNISENLRALLDIMEYTKLHDIPGLMVSLDFKKAFDSLEWDFMLKILEKFNIGPSFIRWVKTVYTGASSCVINNGITSGYFKLGRGVRQGDPLSPYLFVLAVEILGSVIRENNNIRGIMCGHTEVKLLQYADDTNGLLHDLNSAREFIKEVDTFGEYSGLEINKQKSEGMWFGLNRHNTIKPLGINWSEKPVRVLGIYLSYNEILAHESNFEDKLVKIRQTLNMWRSRNLTLHGRIQIVKTFLISQFTYTSSAMLMPKLFIKKVNTLIWHFIWKGGKERLSRIKMMRNLDNGGLCAPDLFSIIEASKISWIRRYLSPNTHVWKTCFEQFLCEADLDPFVIKCNFPMKKNTNKVEVRILRKCFEGMVKARKYNARPKRAMPMVQQRYFD